MWDLILEGAGIFSERDEETRKSKVGKRGFVWVEEVRRCKKRCRLKSHATTKSRYRKQVSAILIHDTGSVSKEPKMYLQYRYLYLKILKILKNWLFDTDTEPKNELDPGSNNTVSRYVPALILGLACIQGRAVSRYRFGRTWIEAKFWLCIWFREPTFGYLLH